MVLMKDTQLVEERNRKVMKIIEKRTQDLLIMRCVLYHSAATAACAQ